MKAYPKIMYVVGQLWKLIQHQGKPPQAIDVAKMTQMKNKNAHQNKCRQSRNVIFFIIFKI